MTNSFPRSALPVVLLLLLLLGVSACSSADAPEASPTPAAQSSPAAPAGDGPTVISPGRPGEVASTGPAAPLEAPRWNDADAAFVQMMVPHHAQALEMTALAEQHARDPAVRALAARVRAAQGPEIVTMSSWLEARGLEVDESMSGMSGMLSEDQLAELAAARGADFDRLFLDAMIAHHRGAVDMAGAVSVEGCDVLVAELAADINLTQTAEIGRMEEMGG